MWVVEVSCFDIVKGKAESYISRHSQYRKLTSGREEQVPEVNFR